MPQPPGGADIFDCKQIVRRIEDRRGVSEQSPRRSGTRRGKRRAAGKLLLQRRGKLRRFERRRRFFNGGKIGALAAEGKRVYHAGRAEQPDAAAGKALRRGKAPREGQLQNERNAAAHRRLGTGELIKRRRLAALHIVARHHGDNGRLRAAPLADGLYLIPVTKVKRVILCHDPDCFHGKTSFLCRLALAFCAKES